MPRFNNDELDDDLYDEFDEDQMSDDDDEPTVLCASCGFEMLEIAYQCPRCGEIPSREFQRTSSQPRWVILTALILIGALLFWILF